MSVLLIEFERVGRRHDVAPLRLASETHADRVAEAIYREAGKYLGSRDYDVDVRLPDDGEVGAFAIGWGRFGGGTIREVSS